MSIVNPLILQTFLSHTLKKSYFGNVLRPKKVILICSDKKKSNYNSTIITDVPTLLDSRIYV